MNENNHNELESMIQVDIIADNVIIHSCGLKPHSSTISYHISQFHTIVKKKERNIHNALTHVVISSMKIMLLLFRIN